MNQEVHSKWDLWWSLLPSLGLTLHAIWCLRMWYPICVSSCPQAEMITCPKNLKQEQTTATTTLSNFYDSIMDSRNGGLPYPPYPVPDAYARYPPQNVFSEQPYLHPQVSYPPPMYPPPPPGGPWKTPWQPGRWGCENFPYMDPWSTMHQCVINYLPS